jgi:hypothetical protein
MVLKLLAFPATFKLLVAGSIPAGVANISSSLDFRTQITLHDPQIIQNVFWKLFRVAIQY